MAVAIPPGSMKQYAGSSAPTGYLLCDGSAVSRTTYADLFTAIGTAYGAGDGSTTFNVPNCKGKVLVGKSASITAFDTLGETGGAKTANLQHSHTGNNHTHTASGNTGGSNSNQRLGASGSSFPNSGHTHSFSITTGNQSDAGSNNQLSATQSIMNPFITLNWLIKV